MALEPQDKKKEEDEKKSYSLEALRSQTSGEMTLPQQAKPAKRKEESACMVEMKERYTYVDGPDLKEPGVDSWTKERGK